MHLPTASAIAFTIPTLVGALANATAPSSASAQPANEPVRMIKTTSVPQVVYIPQGQPTEPDFAPAATHRVPPTRLAPLAPELAQPADTYTAEALAQDATSAYFIDDDNDSIFTFDDAAQIGGSSAIDPEVIFLVTEGRTDLGGSTLIQVEMGAYDINGNPAPWLDSSAAGLGLDSWRFDIGTGAVGGNPIDLEGAFTIVASGMAAFDSTGALLGESPLTEDASTDTALAGVATVGLGGEDIAGFDLTAIQIWWEIEFDTTTQEPGECVGDINKDGVVDIGDINAFVESFLSGCR
ncbi:MAG: hypothetical protein ACF8Q5_08730 [Phycisphaerales bacterium JB040]